MSENDPYVEGSFNKYLWHSGRFVTAMAHAIASADKYNFEKIRQIFPQMVAAYECSSWQIAPENFDPVYNAKKN